MSLGGLVGWNGAANEGIITNSYAIGAVSGGSGSNQIGGLVGYNDSSSNGDADGTITGSYAAGMVSGDNEVGGLVGENDSTITNSYTSDSCTVTGSTCGYRWFSR